MKKVAQDIKLLDSLDMRGSIIREVDSLEAFCKQKGQLHRAVVQGLDLRGLELGWKNLNIQGAIFLGCRFPKEVTVEFLAKKGALVFPDLPGLPYFPYRSKLYTREELMAGWTPKEDLSLDRRIYDHYVAKGRSETDVLEALAQRLHDHAIDDALRDLMEQRTRKSGGEKVVGIMGGHGTSRKDEFYHKVVRIARDLTQLGYFIVTGGGPGTMEAANLGAWLRDVDDAGMNKVLDILMEAPMYTDAGYMKAGKKVLDLYPKGGQSLAVPTWVYGHEPTNLFSPKIAKYFSNSIREDGLLALASHGVIYAPGSAGTTQEIFMDATRNHYGTFGEISPMVFLGEDRYTRETMLYPCLQHLAEGQRYRDFLFCSDDTDAVVDFIVKHPPIIVK